MASWEMDWPVSNVRRPEICSGDQPSFRWVMTYWRMVSFLRRSWRPRLLRLASARSWASREAYCSRCFGKFLLSSLETDDGDLFRALAMLLTDFLSHHIYWRSSRSSMEKCLYFIHF